MNTKNNWHLGLEKEQRYDLHRLLDALVEIADCPHFNANAIAIECLESLETITPPDPK